MLADSQREKNEGLVFSPYLFWRLISRLPTLALVDLIFKMAYCDAFTILAAASVLAGPTAETPQPVTTMKTWEKISSILAIVFAICLVGLLLLFPELRQLNHLLTACLLGMIINVGLMCLVLRDIFLRRFSNGNVRFAWIAMVLFIWPSIIFYLVRHGFRPRN